MVIVDRRIINSPIKPSQIQIEEVIESKDFYSYIFGKKVLHISRDKVFNIRREKVWGYSDGKGAYVNKAVIKNNPRDFIFAKIHILGALSLVHFVETTEIRGYGTYGQYNSYKRTKQTEFILDNKNGILLESTLQNLEKVIADDPDVLYEFKHFKGKKDVKFYSVLRRYNDKHPFSFKR